jgi:hypothetical protein
MSIDDWVTPLDTVPCRSGIDLLDSRMSRFQAMEPFLEEWRQPIVSLSRIDKQSVAPSLGLVEDIQESCSRRLLLI